MLQAYAVKFNMTRNLEIFFGCWGELRPCLVRKNFWFGYCSIFVFI